MNLKKKCRVVLYSTGKQAQKGELFIDSMGRLNLCLINGACRYTGYNLIIISDDKVEVSDFVFLNNSDCGRIMQVKSLIGSDLEKELKKIIATTESLFNYSDNLNQISLSTHIPNPSTQFIQKFISEYNKGNIISEVNVEYEESTPKDYITNHSICSIKLFYPKVDKNNHISITKIKDSWTREEVMNLIEDFTMSTYHIPLNDPKRGEVVNKWIEENL